MYSSNLCVAILATLRPLGYSKMYYRVVHSTFFCLACHVTPSLFLKAMAKFVQKLKILLTHAVAHAKWSFGMAGEIFSTHF